MGITEYQSNSIYAAQAKSPVIPGFLCSGHLQSRTLFKRRSTHPDSVDEMYEFPLHGTHGRVVMLAFCSLLLEECFEIRVVLPRGKGCVEEKSPQCGIAALGEETFAMHGGPTLVDTTIEAEIGHELLRMIETADIPDVPDESGCTHGTDTRDGLQKHLRFRFRLPQPSSHVLEILLEREAELRKQTVELLFGGFLVDLLHASEVLASGLELHHCRVLAQECLQPQNLRRVSEAIAVTGDEYRADRARILRVGFDVTERSVDGLGSEVGIDDGDIPAVIGEENAQEEMIDAGGFETDLGVFLSGLPIL